MKNKVKNHTNLSWVWQHFVELYEMCCKPAYKNLNNKINDHKNLNIPAWFNNICVDFFGTNFGLTLDV